MIEAKESGGKLKGPCRDSSHFLIDNRSLGELTVSGTVLAPVVCGVHATFADGKAPKVAQPSGKSFGFEAATCYGASNQCYPEYDLFEPCQYFCYSVGGGVPFRGVGLH